MDQMSSFEMLYELVTDERLTGFERGRLAGARMLDP